MFGQAMKYKITFKLTDAFDTVKIVVLKSLHLKAKKLIKKIDVKGLSRPIHIKVEQIKRL